MALIDGVKKLFSGDAPEEPPEPRKPWTDGMLPRKAGPGKAIQRSGGGGYYCGSVRLEWVSRETGADGQPLRVRTPKARTATLPEVGFIAAGKPYASRAMLTFRETPGSPWAKDVYGRDVLVLKERFPCFDSSDLLYETRYFRWYFLCRDGKLTCVYHTDNTPTVTVTEDVLDVESGCWEQMQELGCFSGPET